MASSAARRIALVYSAAFAAAILLLGAVVFLAADAEFRRERDYAVAEELAELSRSGGAPLAHEIANRERAQPTDAFRYALFDSAGRRIAGALDTPRPPLGLSHIAFRNPRTGPDTARADAADLPGGSRLVVAIDGEAIARIDATIVAVFGIAFLGILAIGAAGAWALGRYLRRRLAVFSSTARAVAGGATNRRVPVSAHDDEFDAVAVTLNTMLDRIDGLLENLRQVSSDVAHDLRTPLLKLRSQLNRVGTDPAAAARAVAIGDELLRLFAAILQIAEVESGALQRGFRQLDLSALVCDTTEAFEPAITDSGRHLTATIADGITVTGNRELLAQALANLLDNARLHTPPGTAVAVTLAAAAGWVRLSVDDNGPGVPADERERVLRRFYRGEASRTTPGNGLGLNLVAAVAAAHGGTLLLDDAAPGLGVTIALPA